MESKAHVGKKPLHPMLVVIPAGSFIGALLFDVVYLSGGSRAWWDATGPTLLVGIAGALIAAVPGLMDLVKVVPRKGATHVGVSHMVLNLIVVALMVWNASWRWSLGAPPDPGQAYLGFWLSLLSAAILMVSGYLGYRMVHHYRVGVPEAGERVGEHPFTSPEPPKIGR